MKNASDAISSKPCHFSKRIRLRGKSPPRCSVHICIDNLARSLVKHKIRNSSACFFTGFKSFQHRSFNRRTLRTEGYVYPNLASKYQNTEFQCVFLQVFISFQQGSFNCSILRGGLPVRVRVTKMSIIETS
jgi:hypothetical protein